MGKGPMVWYPAAREGKGKVREAVLPGLGTGGVHLDPTSLNLKM